MKRHLTNRLTRSTALVLGTFGMLSACLNPAGNAIAQESPFSLTATEDSKDASADNNPDGEDLLNLDLGRLAETQAAPAFAEIVTSVSRQESTVGRSPAAIYVVTNEMIRRSGAQSVPEALRMVPGLHVARIDANKWAITSRGLNDQFANKLLVQIDGRVVYTPVFAGIYWDIQDLVLEDIERIEVIRGPGATVWGANAVNGVINIITKDTADTTGVYAKGVVGTEEELIGAFRIGGIRDDLSWRVYGKAFQRDNQFDVSAGDSDDWAQRRGGFRLDWEPSDDDLFTFQGDIYSGRSGTNAVFQAPFDDNMHGGNLLGRWTRVLSDESEWSLQAYFDTTDRNSAALLQHVETADLDFQHRFALGCNQNITWGAGYRRYNDYLAPGFTNAITFDPASLTADLYSAFLQDEITLSEDWLYFTLGTKLEKNAYSGFEVQPSMRLLWTHSKTQSFWGAVSRAVRTPDRVQRHAQITLGPVLIGPSPDFSLAEGLISYELGYRSQPTQAFSYDLAMYYNVYDHMVASQRTTGAPPLFQTTSNDASGEAWGWELSSKYQISECWKLTGWYSYWIGKFAEPTTTVPEVPGYEGSSPRNQAYLMSSWDIGCDIEFDAIARYVDRLQTLDVPSYISLDLRLAWRPYQNIEWSVVGQNLLDSNHPEFVATSGAPLSDGEIRRGVYTQLTWRY